MGVQDAETYVNLVAEMRTAATDMRESRSAANQLVANQVAVLFLDDQSMRINRSGDPGTARICVTGSFSKPSAK